MKIHASILLLAIATMAALPSISSAQDPAPAPVKAAASTKSKHIRLCEQLGLKVGGRYEFLLEAQEVHYYEVRSLGANGWVLMKDSIASNIWVNLSRVISITPVPSR